MSHQLAIDNNLKHFTSDIINEYDSRPLTQKLCKLVPQLLLDYPQLKADYDSVDTFVSQTQKSEIFTKDKVLLDFACGTGIISEQLYPFVKQLIGIDINQHVLDIFNKRLNKYDNVESHLVDILEESLVTSNLIGSVDIITCTISYHHLGDYESITAKLAQFLAPGGVLFIVDFYNPNVEQLGDGRVSEDSAVTHMGGLRKQSLLNTLSKAQLKGKVEIIPGIKSWYHEQFIKNHCAVETMDQLKAGTLPTKQLNGDTLYFIDIDLVVAVGTK